jgi:dTDP-4-dehydrorhamnose 3,5-epimerase
MLFRIRRGGKKMGQFNFEKCLDIEGLFIIEPKIFSDERGYNLETYNEKDFAEAGLDMKFVQDNQSMSIKGVLRGLHFQKNYQQGKLVRVTRGEVFDVAVDLREGSKTYGKWFGVILSAEKKNMFYVPEGFAHGFLVLSDYAEFAYKLSDYYHPEDESGIAWNDKTLNIDWSIPEGMKIITSDRDGNHPAFSDGIVLKPKRKPFADTKKF